MLFCDKASIWSDGAAAFLRQSSSQQHGAEITDPFLASGTDGILAFIALLDTASQDKVTGWNLENAKTALHRMENSTSQADFDFFSHVDLGLREHLRQSYDRHKQIGCGCDIEKGLIPQVSVPPQAATQEPLNPPKHVTVKPVKESRRQRKRREKIECMDKDNAVMEEVNVMFTPTLGPSETESESE